jgi:hypothetical protein
MVSAFYLSLRMNINQIYLAVSIPSKYSELPIFLTKIKKKEIKIFIVFNLTT